MGRPELRLLKCELNVPLAREMRLNGVCAVTDDNGNGFRRQGAGYREHTVQKRPARDPVKDLGSARFHSGALASGQHHDLNRFRAHQEARTLTQKLNRERRGHLPNFFAASTAA
jgi:hypothetical protein